MNSHGIPFVSKDETVKKREGQRKTPNKGEKTGSYRQPLSSDETTEIRRASEQTSPPGGKRVGRPAMGQWADRVVAATRSAFFIFGASKPQQRSRKANGE